MNCPKCGHLQTCPCEACQERIPTEKPYIHKEDDLIACGECGHTLHAFEWMDIEAEQYEKLKSPQPKEQKE